MIAQNLLAAVIELVHDRHAAAIGELPLLLRAVDVSAIVIQMAEALLEPGLRIAAQEGIQERGAQVLVSIEELE